MIFKASDKTEFGVGYLFKLDKPETNLRLGFQHALSDSISLKGRINQ